MSSAPPATPPIPAPEHGPGMAHAKSSLLGFALLWLSVFVIQTLAGYTGYKEKLVALDQAMTHSLEGLDPFVLANDFYSRWSQPHSLRVWSVSAPFNVRVHDDNILKQLRALTAQAPTKPENPQTIARRQATDSVVLGHASILDLPARDPAADALAAAKYQSGCQEYLARFREWEKPYHDLARGLTNFDEAAYSSQMQRSCGGKVTFSAGTQLFSGPAFYDRSYGSDLLSPGNEGKSLLAGIWQGLLGFPDAFLFAVGSAFSHGAFQSFMAIFLIVLAYGMIAKGNPIIVLPILPLLARAFGWFALEMVRLAHASLHSVLSITAIPMVGSLSIWPISGLVEALRSIAEHDVAHRVASAAENIIK